MFKKFTTNRKIKALKRLANKMTTMHQFRYITCKLIVLTDKVGNYSQLHELEDIRNILQSRLGTVLDNSNKALYENHPLGMKP